MIRLVDANSYLRRVVESDASGLVLRSVLAQVRDGDVFVWDGPNALAWRREIYPRYKTRRAPATESIYASLELLRECLRHTAAIQIRVPGHEADDVVATLARSAAGEVVVETTDFDLKVLEVAPGVKVTALYPKSAPPGLKPDEIRLYKTLVGDPSDGVAGVPGFGSKAWETEDLREWGTVVALIADGVEPTLPLYAIRDRFKAWLSLEANRAELLATWTVVGLADVPLDLIEDHTTAGVPDPGRVEQLLKASLQ